MRPPASLTLVVLLAAAVPARPAAAAPPDEPARGEPDVALALVAGVATALVPITLGGIHTAAAPVGDDPARNVGFAVAGVGPALAPFVAHAVLGEWGRAAAFSAAPVASEIAVCVLLQAQPDAVFHGTVGSRTTFGLIYTADILGATIGLLDVMMAPERARERRAAKRSGFTIAPRLGRGQAGVVLGGVL